MLLTRIERVPEEGDNDTEARKEKAIAEILVIHKLFECVACGGRLKDNDDDQETAENPKKSQAGNVLHNPWATVELLRIGSLWDRGTETLVCVG